MNMAIINNLYGAFGRRSRAERFISLPKNVYRNISKKLGRDRSPFKAFVRNSEQAFQKLLNNGQQAVKVAEKRYKIAEKDFMKSDFVKDIQKGRFFTQRSRKVQKWYKANKPVVQKRIASIYPTVKFWTLDNYYGAKRWMKKSYPIAQGWIKKKYNKSEDWVENRVVDLRKAYKSYIPEVRSALGV